MDPEGGALGISDDLRRHAGQAEIHLLDQLAKRFPHGDQVLIAMRLEPGLGVLSSEAPEERQGVGLENGAGRAGQWFLPMPWWCLRY